MSTGTRNGWLLIWAVLGVPLFFSAAVHSAYQITNPPFYSTVGTFASFAIFGVFALSGIFALSQLSFAKWQRLALCILYAAGIFVAETYLGFHIMCSYGDCI